MNEEAAGKDEVTDIKEGDKLKKMGYNLSNRTFKRDVRPEDWKTAVWRRINWRKKIKRNIRVLDCEM